MNGTVGMYDERQRKGASALHAGFPGCVTRDVSSEEECFSRVECVLGYLFLRVL